MPDISNGRYVHLRGATSAAHVEGDHLLVPVVALIGDTVIHAVNSPVPELVPLATLSSAPDRWISKPIVLGHPTENGRQISANSPLVLERHGMGEISSAQITNNKLCVEARIDVARAEKLGGPKFLEQLKNGTPCEVSVGAFVQTTEVEGTQNGKSYKARWDTLMPDHLAFLATSTGACSIEAGCGSHRAATTYLVTAEGMEEVNTLRERFTTLLGHFVTADLIDFTKCSDDALTRIAAEFAPPDGDLKAAIGARHSGSDQQKIQTMHDHAVDLGATCRYAVKAAETHPCSCHQGVSSMKTDVIKALIANPHSGFTVADEKMLEAADEARLSEFQEAADKRAVAVKAEEDDKAKVVAEADAKVKAAEAKLKAAAEYVPTEDEYLAKAPQSIRTLVAEKKAQDAAEHAELVASLKTAAEGIYTDEELAAKPNAELKKLAQMADVHVSKPDYSGRAIPRVAAEKVDDVYSNPPDPYEPGLKILREGRVQ